MNQYKLLITSQDYYGHNFIDNIVKYAQKGAVINKKERFFNDYPHACTMMIETEEFLKSEPSVEVVVIREEWTKEGLNALDWESFKRLVATKEVGGRHRETMTNQFLKVNEVANE